jgi:hypothetical protein
MGFRGRKPTKKKAKAEPVAEAVVAKTPVKGKREWLVKFKEKYHRDPVSDSELERFVYWQEVGAGWKK